MNDHQRIAMKAAYNIDWINEAMPAAPGKVMVRIGKLTPDMLKLVIDKIGPVDNCALYLVPGTTDDHQQ